MSDPERNPDVNAAAALALIQAENDYRTALVGPVSPDALPLLQAEHLEDGKPEPGCPTQAANWPASTQSA